MQSTIFNTRLIAIAIRLCYGKFPSVQIGKDEGRPSFG
jgi:hypothetical protein